MKKAVFIPNLNKDPDLSVTSRAAGILKELGMEVIVEDVYTNMVKGARFQRDFPTDADLLIVVGGDGSVIDASKYSIEYGMPMIGINLGKVGYLSEIDPGELDVLRKALSDLELALDVVSDVLTSERNGCVVTHDAVVIDCYRSRASSEIHQSYTVFHLGLAEDHACSSVCSEIFLSC